MTPRNSPSKSGRQENKTAEKTRPAGEIRFRTSRERRNGSAAETPTTTCVISEGTLEYHFCNSHFECSSAQRFIFPPRFSPRNPTQSGLSWQKNKFLRPLIVADHRPGRLIWVVDVAEDEQPVALKFQFRRSTVVGLGQKKEGLSRFECA